MKLAIVQREGVIQEATGGYGASAPEWRTIPGAMEAVARLCQAGYRVFVVSALAVPEFGAPDFEAFSNLHDRLQKSAGELGARIDAVLFSGENGAASASLLSDLSRRLGVSLKNVPVVAAAAPLLEAARGLQARVLQVGVKSAATAAENFEDLRSVAAALAAA